MSPMPAGAFASAAVSGAAVVVAAAAAAFAGPFPFPPLLFFGGRPMDPMPAGADGAASEAAEEEAPVEAASPPLGGKPMDPNPAGAPPLPPFFFFPPFLVGPEASGSKAGFFLSVRRVVWCGVAERCGRQ